MAEIPSTALRAGSSLHLKSGCAQDDAPIVGYSANPSINQHQIQQLFDGAIGL